MRISFKSIHTDIIRRVVRIFLPMISSAGEHAVTDIGVLRYAMSAIKVAQECALQFLHHSCPYH